MIPVIATEVPHGMAAFHGSTIGRSLTTQNPRSRSSATKYGNPRWTFPEGPFSSRAVKVPAANAVVSSQLPVHHKQGLGFDVKGRGV